MTASGRAASSPTLSGRSITNAGSRPGRPRKLAAYFRQVMPDRHNAVAQLLSGANEFIEPTMSRPASGSFSGGAPQNVSGVARAPAIPMGSPRFAPNSNSSLAGASYPLPVGARPQKSSSRVILWIGLAAMAVSGIAVFLSRTTHPDRPPRATAAAVVSTPSNSDPCGAADFRCPRAAFSTSRTRDCACG